MTKLDDMEHAIYLLKDAEQKIEWAAQLIGPTAGDVSNINKIEQLREEASRIAKELNNNNTRVEEEE